MNTLCVICSDEELMEKCDNEFLVVTHKPEKEQKIQYSGEFVIYDPRSLEDIQYYVKKMKNNLTEA